MGVRKWLSLIGILSILSSLVVSIPMASALSVDDYVKLYPVWAQEKVAAAVEAGLRDPNIVVDPGAAIDRATACFILVKAFGEDSGVDEGELEMPFTDVADTLWYAGAAKQCAAFGWFAGRTNADGTREFLGSEKFTHEQKAVVLWAMAGKPEADFDATFEGVDGSDKISSWAQSGAAWGRENNIVFGTDSINPQASSNNDDFTYTVVAFQEAEPEISYEPVEVDEEEGEEEEEEEEEEGEEEEEEEEEGEPPVVPTTAALAVASDTPAAAVLASGTAYNPVLKFSVTAGAEADLQVTSITVTRGGLSANANVSGIGVFDAAGVRHGNIGTSWNDSNAMEVSFAADPIVVAKGTSSFILLKANLAVGAMTGTVVLSVAKAEHFVSNATLTATFPLSSNAMTLADGTNSVAAVTVDAIQVHNNGTADATAVNVNLGTTRQHIGTFRLTNSAVEGVKIKSLVFYNNGSAGDGDFKNITLVAPDGGDLKVVDTTTNKYVKFEGLEYPLAKSASAKDFKIYADVMSGSTRTFRLLLQNDYDLVVVGDTSGADILPTLAAANDLAFPVGDRSGANFINMVTVSAGTLSLAKATNSPTGNVAAGGTNILLARYEVKPSGEDMEIRQFSYTVGTSSSSVLTLAGTLYFKVREAVDGSATTTLYSISGASADYANSAAGTTYTTTFVKLTAGKTYYVDVTGDINSTATSGLTYTVQAFDITQTKRLGTNDIVDPGVTAVNANALTVQTGALTVTGNASAAAVNVVAGQATQTTFGTWDFTAGAGEGINLTTITVGTTAGVTGNVFKDLELWIDGAKKSQDTSTTISPTAANLTTGIAFNITGGFTVPAAQTSLVEVKGKIVTGASAGTVTLQMTASGVSGTGSTSQASITAPTAAVSGQVVTVSASGTLTVTRDTVTNVKSTQIVAGSVNVVFGSYKLQTGNIEDVKVKKITVRNIGSNTNGLSNIGIYDGATLLNDDAATTPSEGQLKSLGVSSSVIGNDTKSVTFDYSDRPYTIAKNSFKLLTVKANTVYNATNGSTVQLVIDSLELEGSGSAARIYPAITTETASGASTNAFAVGEILALSDGQAIAAGADTGTSSFAGVVTTAAAAGANIGAAVGTVVDGVDLVNGTSTHQITKINPVYFGSSIVSEVVSATASAAATYSYAVGDVVAISDDDTVANNNFHVVTTAVVATTNDLDDAGDLVTGITLANADRISRVASGFSETTLSAAATNYTVGDILAVTDIGTPANNGLYVVGTSVASAGNMVTSDLVRLQSGASIVDGDYVAKMPTLHTEAPSASATYAYAVGDVIVIDDAGTAGNNGMYVVGTAVAVGGSLLAADALGTGVTFVAADRISKLYVKSQEDNLKRLYPTKLNFTWTAAASTTLLTGSQQEVGRFTLGADVANANNPGASVSVTALNLTELSTATLVNFTLNDVTQNANVATNANSSSFSSTAAGGTLSTLTFQQGETRTFKILADVATNAGSQIAQFRYNSGSQFAAGSATWSATGAATVNAITWTVLAGDAADALSSSLQAAATGTDTAAPTITSITMANVATAGMIAATDTITVLFSEKIDPATISTSLIYGTALTGVGSTTNGGLASANTGTSTTFTIPGVSTFVYNCLGGTSCLAAIGSSTSDYIVTDTLDSVANGGDSLLITLTTVTAGAGGQATQAGTASVGTGTQVASTVKDAAGNTMTAAAIATVTGSL